MAWKLDRETALALLRVLDGANVPVRRGRNLQSGSEGLADGQYGGFENGGTTAAAFAQAGESQAEAGQKWRVYSESDFRMQDDAPAADEEAAPGRKNMEIALGDRAVFSAGAGFSGDATLSGGAAALSARTGNNRPTGADMAAISRFFERDARRYG